MRFRSVNPVLKRMSDNTGYVNEYAATYKGVITKTALLLLIMIVMGSLSMFTMVETGQITGGIFVLIGAPILAFISLMIAMRKPDLAPIFSLAYAMLQGTFLGVISGIYTVMVGDEIVGTALLATGGVFVSMLLLYRSGVVRVTNTFRKVMYTALLGLLFSSIVMIGLMLFGAFSPNMMGLYTVIVVVSVIVASLYLIIDFDNITNMVEAGADRQLEWVFSLGLMVTVVWLYVELLRLLFIISSSRK